MTEQEDIESERQLNLLWIDWVDYIKTLGSHTSYTDAYAMFKTNTEPFPYGKP